MQLRGSRCVNGSGVPAHLFEHDETLCRLDQPENPSTGRFLTGECLANVAQGLRHAFGESRRSVGRCSAAHVQLPWTSSAVVSSVPLTAACRPERRMRPMRDMRFSELVARKRSVVHAPCGNPWAICPAPMGDLPHAAAR